jgi:hypothetical protein
MARFSVESYASEYPELIDKKTVFSYWVELLGSHDALDRLLYAQFINEQLSVFEGASLIELFENEKQSGIGTNTRYFMHKALERVNELMEDGLLSSSITPIISPKNIAGVILGAFCFPYGDLVELAKWLQDEPPFDFAHILGMMYEGCATQLILETIRNGIDKELFGSMMEGEVA